MSASAEQRRSGESSPVEPGVWARPAPAVREELGVGDDGLDEEEVRRRRERWGRNEIRESERRSTASILWEQVRSLIMLLLVGAMVVSFVTGQLVEGAAIAVVIVLNTLIGFLTELRAVRSMEALKRLGEVEARVRRGGRWERIPAEDLVPGDVLWLEAGDVVPADLRLVRVEGLEVDESALTGESTPVAKQAEPAGEEAEVSQRPSMVFKGTVISRGEAEALVVGTGMSTELGEIAAMVESAEGGQTPLEQRLDALGRRLVWLTLFVAAVVAVAGIVAGRDLYLMLQTAIALAVAAIPEGLPIVATVALAHGMWLMLRRNALIRRLSSVETLGSTTLICTDKTGTLTESHMTAVRLVLDGEELDLDRDELTVEPESPAAEALEVAVLCNEASLSPEADRGQDPMEVALLELGVRARMDRGSLLETRPQVRTVPFDRETKMMATLHRADDQVLVAVKGAPEAVITASSSGAGGEPLDEDGRQGWMDQVGTLAAEGLRVLALARRRLPSDDGSSPYEDLELLGLVGLLDPPRSGVREAVDTCRKAGIRVVMVTGDHPATAREIARELRIAGEERPALVEGARFPSRDQMDDESGREIVRASVLARVTPRQKLDLIDLHQEDGQVVAMTGDGVNDAPALRRADIGIAMGRRGTDVARQAADMVLEDDRFSTIVAAVERGRVIFDNIRRFAVYLLSGNVGEILAVGAAAVVGAPLPLLPLQILYLNMLNDVFPALALGLGGASGGVMTRPPRDPSEQVLPRRHWVLIMIYGALVGGSVLAAFAASLLLFDLGVERSVTVAFLTVSIGRLLHAFNMRSPESGLIRNEITTNPYIWGALGICLALLAAAVYLPPLAEVLRLTHPGPIGWAVIAAGCVMPLIVGQLVVLVLRYK